MNKFDLNNRTAVITGGAQGFGLDIAKKFINFGAKVIIWDIDEQQLQKASKEIINKDIFSASETGAYYFLGGWHIKAIYSLFIAFVFSAATIWNPDFRFLQSYSWLIGAFVGFVMHYLLSEK